MHSEILRNSGMASLLHDLHEISLRLWQPPSVASKPKPVMFPLGRSSRATILLATGSLTFTKTIGIVRVSRWTPAVGIPRSFRVETAKGFLKAL